MKKISILAILLIILLAGCSLNETSANTTSQNYSFDNPDVIAYVGGDPVSKASMDNYIIMKKAYMEALETKIEGYSDSDDLIFSDRVYIEWNMEQINETKSYSSEKDWTKDYYKSIFLSKKFHDLLMGVDVDEEVKNVLDKAESTDIDPNIDIYPVPDSESDTDSYPIPDSGIIVEIDDITLDVVPVIQSVADDLGISFEECVNSIYRPFLITEREYELLLNIKYDGVNYGDQIEYDGTNDLEYGNYVLNAMEINRDYLNSLFAKAEIVERP